jgi:hypothetical protein
LKQDTEIQQNLLRKFLKKAAIHLPIYFSHKMPDHWAQ